MKKGNTFLIALLVVGVGLFFTIDKMKYTTYGEVISEMIGNEEVINITIVDWENHREFNTENKEFINKLLLEPSSMEMKKSNDSIDVDYTINIETNQGKNYDMGLGKSNVTISHSGRFKFINNNELYQIIQNEDWDWRKD